MGILGPTLIVVGVAIVVITILKLSKKKKDNRTDRQKHLDEISKIRGDKK